MQLVQLIICRSLKYIYSVVKYVWGYSKIVKYFQSCFVLYSSTLYHLVVSFLSYISKVLVVYVSLGVVGWVLLSFINLITFHAGDALILKAKHFHLLSTCTIYPN